MITSLALCAFAAPPRGEVIVGWSGNVDQGNAVATYQPALLRTNDASFVVRATFSEQYYPFLDGVIENRVASPGVSVGPGFVYLPGEFVLGLAVGIEGRQLSRKIVGQQAVRTLAFDASLSGNVEWRPLDKGAIYGLFSFSAANEYLWIRAGAMHPLIPFSGSAPPVALWAGVEGTTRGNGETRVFDVGPVIEVPLREARAVFSLRGGLSVYQVQGQMVQQGTLGLGLYWAY